MGYQEGRADAMAINKHSAVPLWVRSTICVVGYFSVPALVLASCLGTTINPYLATVVGLFAIRTSTFAFAGSYPPLGKPFLRAFGVAEKRSPIQKKVPRTL